MIEISRSAVAFEDYLGHALQQHQRNSSGEVVPKTLDAATHSTWRKFRDYAKSIEEWYNGLRPWHAATLLDQICRAISQGDMQSPKARMYGVGKDTVISTRDRKSRNLSNVDFAAKRLETLDASRREAFTCYLLSPHYFQGNRAEVVQVLLYMQKLCNEHHRKDLYHNGLDTFWFNAIRKPHLLTVEKAGSPYRILTQHGISGGQTSVGEFFWNTATGMQTTSRLGQLPTAPPASAAPVAMPASLIQPNGPTSGMTPSLGTAAVSAPMSAPVAAAVAATATPSEPTAAAVQDPLHQQDVIKSEVDAAPYIKRELDDEDGYATIFESSVATNSAKRSAASAGLQDKVPDASATKRPKIVSSAIAGTAVPTPQQAIKDRAPLAAEASKTNLDDGTNLVNATASVTKTHSTNASYRATATAGEDQFATTSTSTETGAAAGEPPNEPGSALLQANTAPSQTDTTSIQTDTAASQTDTTSAGDQTISDHTSSGDRLAPAGGDKVVDDVAYPTSLTSAGGDKVVEDAASPSGLASARGDSDQTLATSGIDATSDMIERLSGAVASGDPAASSDN